MPALLAGQAYRYRGLCLGCFNQPEVKALYSAKGINGRRGVKNFYGTPKLPDRATAALPGTLAKVEVMVERAAAGRALWHPRDATKPD